MLNFLVIDDSKSLRSLYEVLLKKRYHNAFVDEAANGEEALAYVLNSNYSVVITDINMPLMGGLEFYEKLKEIRPELMSRVCFTSATFNESKFYLLKEGYPFLAKPFLIKEFYSIVDAVLDSAEKEIHHYEGKFVTRTKRYRVNEPCTLEPVSSYSTSGENLRAEVVDYSKDGLGLKYSGGQLPSGTKVEISVESLKIFERKAEIVWTRPFEGDIQSGVHWI